MSFEQKFTKDQIKEKFNIWLDHRSAQEFIFRSGYDNFSIIPVVKK